MSASRIRSSNERPASAKAMPAEALASTRWPVIANGEPKQPRTHRAAHRRRPRRGSCAARRTRRRPAGRRNRPRASLSLSLSARPQISSSPAWWPSVSLMSLKRSTSTQAMASREPPRLGPRGETGEAGFELAPVGEAGQRVVIGEVLRRRLAGLERARGGEQPPGQRRDDQDRHGEADQHQRQHVLHQQQAGPPRRPAQLAERMAVVSVRRTKLPRRSPLGGPKPRSGSSMSRPAARQ